MQVTLNILKSDILEANYFSFKDCPITRALKRAGFPELCDSGLGIESHGAPVNTISDPAYKDLTYKVVGMYIGEGLLDGTIPNNIYPVQPAADFSVTLDLNYIRPDLS